MSGLTLLAAAIASAATGILYLRVARVLMHRQVAREAALPWSLFVFSWQALAATAWLGAALYVAAGLEILSVPMAAAVASMQGVATSMAAFGLTAYLAFVGTGRREGIWVAASLYLPYLLVWMVIMASDVHVGLSVGDWSVRVVSGSEVGPVLAGWLVVALVAPVGFGLALYVALIPRVGSRALKYRASLAATSIGLWAGSHLVGASHVVADARLGPPLPMILGLLSAFVLMWGYRPRPGVDAPLRSGREAK